MAAKYDDALRRKIDREFQWINDKIYLDYAGAGLHSSKQIEAAAKDLCTNLYGNPHSLHDASRLCSDSVYQIRTRILDLFHTTHRDYSVIFTSGATAAIKLLLDSFNWNGCTEENTEEDDKWFDAVGSRGCFAYTRSNHTSVVGCRMLAEERKAKVVCVEDKTAEKLMNVAEKHENLKERSPSNSLFVYPAQCNFSGKKFPLHWLKNAQNLSNHPEVEDKNTNWFCLLDAATFCATNELDLSKIEADFVCLSFYKLFGYPTGLGALLVKNKSVICLRRRYFGGGTVDVLVPSNSQFVLRKSIHDRFEDGTLPFLSIISLSHGFDTLSRLGLTMQRISHHVFHLASHCVTLLESLVHWNGTQLVELYCDSMTHENQGGIVAFNLRRSDGSYIGYNEVLKVANSANILLRTGCFCNIGACQKYLGIKDSELLENFQMGHVCGDDRDLINSKPTGAVRISFGYPSSSSDIHALIHLIRETFLERIAPLQFNAPLTYSRTRTLRSIRLYPVKSCGAQQVEKWSVTSRGLLLDRNWMIVTSSGICLTQKNEPLLCCILPVVDPKTKSLQLSYKGADPISINYIENSESFQQIDLCWNKVCGDDVIGADCGEDAADWLVRHLNREGLRLVQQTTDDNRKSYSSQLSRKINQEMTEVEKPISLANQAQFLVINSASVDWLRRKIIDEPHFNPDTLEDRFRANFIVNGVSSLEELNWSQIKIGNLQLKIDGPCTRCQMICIDQHTGEKNRKPLVELSRALGGKLRFGLYCSHDVLHDINVAVGDQVLVEESNENT